MVNKSTWLAIIASFILACGSFTFSFFRGASEHKTLCRVVQRLAEANKEGTTVLPKVSIPGLTHTELEMLTLRKLEKYERLAKEACE